jgi:hypothetical protein
MALIPRAPVPPMNPALNARQQARANFLTKYRPGDKQLQQLNAIPRAQPAPLSSTPPAGYSNTGDRGFQMPTGPTQGGNTGFGSGVEPGYNYANGRPLGPTPGSNTGFGGGVGMGGTAPQIPSGPTNGNSGFAGTAAGGTGMGGTAPASIPRAPVAETQPAQPTIDADRINTRINFLRKTQPNSPEIAQLQTKLAAQPAAKAPAGTPDTARQAARLAWLQKNRPNDPQIKQLQASLGTQAPPSGGTPPPDNSTPNPANNPQPDVATGDAPPTDYKTYRDFLPADITSSPEYQYRLSEGEKQLNARLAAQGLSGSGSAILRDANLTNGLTADETSRQTELAKGEADRYERTQENAANRTERQSQDQWTRLSEILHMMSDQNPLSTAYQGTQQYTGTVEKRGKGKAARIGDHYGRVQGGGGGGGGGGQAPAYTPPFGQPDYSMLNFWNNGANTSSNSGYLGGLGQILGGLGGLFK